jgi:hypothetical protein
VRFLPKQQPPAVLPGEPSRPADVIGSLRDLIETGIERTSDTGSLTPKAFRSAARVFSPRRTAR